MKNIVQVLDRTLFQRKPMEKEAFLRGYQQVRALPEDFEERFDIIRAARRIPRDRDWWTWM